MRRSITISLIAAAILGWFPTVHGQDRTGIATVSSLPPHCEASANIVGKTGADAGLYFCIATDTWALVPHSVYAAKTGTYTMAGTDMVIECQTNAFTVNLPAAASYTSKIFVIANWQATHACTIDPNASEVILDNASHSTYALESGALWIISDGTHWVVIGQATPSLSNPGAAAAAIWDSTNNVYQAINIGAYSVLANFTNGSALAIANNAMPVPQPMYYIAGVSQASVASISCDLPTSGFATAVDAANVHYKMGVPEFSGSVSNEMICRGITPPDWLASSQMDITVFWRSTAGSVTGHVVWSFSTLFAGQDQDWNGTPNAASTSTALVSTTSRGTTVTTKTNITATGIGASKLFWLDIGRLTPGASGDDMSGAAQIAAFIITIRRNVPYGG